MKSRSSLRWGIGGLYFIFVVTGMAQTQWFVDAARPDDSGDGLSWETAKRTIQAAVNAATAGDTVWVADGLYNEGTTIVPGGALPCRVVLTKNLTISGTSETARVLIEGVKDPSGDGRGSNAVRCVYMTTGVLANLILTNGFVLTGGSVAVNLYGGGVYATGGYLTNCVITGCGALHGGGAWGANLFNCLIENNFAYNTGGGARGGLLVGCIVRGNRVTITTSSAYAGGVYGATVQNCQIHNNTNLGYYGGGVYGGTVVDSVVASNYAALYGGGAYQAVLSNCLIAANIAMRRGGGLYQGSAVDCRIEGNQNPSTTVGSSGSGGAYGAILSRCVIVSNMTTFGGGGVEGGVATNCIFKANIARENGGGALGAGLVNCLVVENQAGQKGGGVYGGTVNFSTIVGNQAFEGGGIAQATSRNSIVWNNRRLTGTLNNYDLGSVFLRSCTAPLPEGTGNLSDDPQLVSAEGGDYRLRAGSPCFDQGDAGEVNWAVDLAGHSRQQGEGPDLGAYEGSVAGAVVTVRIMGRGSVSPRVGVFADASAEVTFSAQETGRSFVGFRLNGGPLQTDPEWTLSGITEDGILEAEFERAEFYADASRPDDSGDGTSWATAKRTLQAAVDLASDGDIVWVAAGLYNQGGRFTPGTNLMCRLVLTNNVRVVAVEGPSATILAGAPDPGTGHLGVNAVRGLYMTAGVVEGLTISNGFVQMGTAPETVVCGGGVFATGGYLTNCVIARSLARSGGGLYGATLYDCRIEDNSAQLHGGGACSSVLVRCTVTDNVASNQGGGVYGGLVAGSGLFRNRAVNGGGAAGSAFLDQSWLEENVAQSGGGGAFACDLLACTVTNNAAPYGGGIHGGRAQNTILCGNNGWREGGGAQNSALYFCTVVGNQSYEGAGVHRCQVWNSIVWENRRMGGLLYNAWNSVFTNSCVWPLEPGVGNLAENPLFVSAAVHDFRLRAASPCVNGADGSYCFVPLDVDGAGRSRTEGGAPDMGAREGAWGGAVVTLQIRGAGTVTPSGAVVLATSASTQQFVAVAANEARPFLQYRLNGTPIGTDPVLNLSGITEDSVLEAVFDQRNWYADAARPDDSGDGSSWATAKKTLQAAIDLALDGDTVWVADGTYSTGGAVTPGGTLPCRMVVLRDIAIRGTNSAVGAIISGGSTARGTGAVRCVYMEKGLLDSLRLDRGATFTGTSPALNVHGGGLYVPARARVALTNVYIARCLGESGAGVYAAGARLEGTACTITNNTATYIAGGTYGGRWVRSDISKNRADLQGGGAYDAWLIGCNIEGNYLVHNSSSCGAALYRGVVYQSRVLTNSTAYSGGGVAYADLFECDLISNVVRRSDNLSVGGGVIGGYLSHCRLFGNRASASPAAHNAVLRNCLVYRNVATGTGGSTTYYAALYNCTLVNCVVVSNTGARYGGMQAGSATNSILLENRVFTNMEMVVNYYGTTLRSCATWPHPGGVGNIEVGDVGTVFRDYLADDYRLSADSPCRDAGDNASVIWAFDIAGQPRIQGAAVDMGTYECPPPRRGTLIYLR